MLIKTEWTFRLLCYNNPSQKQAGALCCDCTVQHVRLCFLSLLCQLSNKFIILRLKRSNDANVLRVYSTCVDSMFPERESSEAHCSFPSRWCWSYFHWFLGNPPLCPSEEHVKEYFRAASQPWLCSSPCCVLSIRNWIFTTLLSLLVRALWFSFSFSLFNILLLQNNICLCGRKRPISISSSSLSSVPAPRLPSRRSPDRHAS